ncbi:MAG: glycosyltransferase family 39 protein [Proteobacteria bacterium]|nr:glycosyltransferase family 39 protein [Pseudomonadota bacterium]
MSGQGLTPRTLNTGWLICWAVTVFAALALRPPLPVDETRYLAVAWSMWLDGDWLVPHLNGEAYHHKPPLLFWLMNATWAVFGVNDWAPRLVAPLFALAGLFMTRSLARKLWPDHAETAELAPAILTGTFFWALFGTLTMFDMMLAVATLVGLCGVVGAWRGGGIRSWAIVAVAVGIGILAKGPAILLHILPAALLAPIWGPALSDAPARPVGGWKRWYLAVLLAVLGGALIGLAWAVPAGIRGGEAYRNMIFWGQSAGRIVEAFDHARPFWWYAAVLPPLLLPWLLWPRLWRAFRAMPMASDGALRLLACWLVPAFAVFSLISGKQLHYLLPEFPALALLFARALARAAATDANRAEGGDIWLPASIYMVLGAVGGLAGFLPLPFDAPDWFAELATGWAFLAAAAGLLLGLARPAGKAAIAGLMGSSGILVVALHLVAADALTHAYDLRPLAARLKALEQAGHPLANFATYHGQYHFLGRLKQPMPELGLERVSTETYLRDHPNGVVVAYYDNPPAGPAGIEPLGRYRLRDLTILLWPVEAFRLDPTIGDRR